MRIFIGTYTKTTSAGIYATDLDVESGQLSEPVVAAETSNPTFLAFDPQKTHLFAVHGSAKMAVAYAIDPATRQLVPKGPHPSDSGPAPCHLAVDATGEALTVTNYHTGTVASLAIKTGGVLGTPQVITHTGHSVDPKRQAEPHPHSVIYTPDNKYALVCDLGLDKIFAYPLTPKGAHLEAGPAYTLAPPGSGPRHSIFSPDQRHFYVVTEISSTVLAYAFSPAKAALSPLARYSTLPEDYVGDSTAAEIGIHPSGKYLYASNRGHDSIVIFARDPARGLLDKVATVSCGGENPRNFAVSADGDWLVCANQDSNNLVSFAVEDGGKRLVEKGNPVSVPQPVCVAFFA